jgi:hypothetical protein
MTPPVLLCAAAERVVGFPKAASVSATKSPLRAGISRSSFTLLPPAALFQPTMICGEDPSRRYPRMLRIVSLFPRESAWGSKRE